MASSWWKSNADINRIDGTLGNTTIEAGDLSVNKKSFERRTHTHHQNCFKLFLQESFTMLPYLRGLPISPITPLQMEAPLQLKAVLPTNFDTIASDSESSKLLSKLIWPINN